MNSTEQRVQDFKSTLPKPMRQKFGNLLEFTRFCFPEGSTIGCDECKVERHCTVEEIAEWLTSGYPRCKKCGGKTTLDNPHVKALN